MSSERCHRCRSPMVVAALAVLGILSIAGCVPGAAGGADDKAGGAADPVVLRLATTSYSLDFHPALQYFVDQVKQRVGWCPSDRRRCGVG